MDQEEYEASEEYSENDGDATGEFGELSLDDLGTAYARAAAAHDPQSFKAPETPPESDEATEEDDDAVAPIDSEESNVHPEGIVEAALFVGHPENQSFTAARLASLMRDVTEEEVIAMIDHLNASYKQEDQAVRIIEDENGYRMTIAPAVESIRQSFLGKVREARLSQAAIEVLALVAYQPGITAQAVQDQRGRESGTLLNQLVRRRLLEMRRQKPQDGGRKIPHYFPTERFLTLFGLESIEDLPMVDESFMG